MGSRSIQAVQAKHLYLWGIDSRELKRITSGDVNDITPEWSPDAKQLAFVSARTGHNEIFVTDVNGGAVRQLFT
jgi:Tol biopolymer transport system component